MMKQSIAILFVLTINCIANCMAIDFYVSPQGNDTNAGTKERPFASLVRARDEVRKLIASGLAEDVNVYIRGGRYPLESPLVFTPQDSGSDSFRISYAAYAGEKPVFSGGRVIKGFEEMPNGIWRTQIPEVESGQWYFEQLFINGRRAVRARTPNTFYHYMIGVEQEVLSGDGRWPKSARQTIFADRDSITPLFDMDAQALSDVIMTIYHKWNVTLRRIDSVDPDSDSITTLGRGIKAWNKWQQNTRFHLENFKAALDAEGEWFLDRDGTLYYIPLDGESPETVRAVAPVSDGLIFVKGGPGKAVVKNLSFRGLSFQHSIFSTPSKGFPPLQAAATLEAAAIFDGADTVRIEDCEFAHVGKHAVWFRKACRDCGVFRSHIHDMGAGGVYIGEVNIAKTEAERTGRITVDNCIIHNGGNILPCAVGVWIGQSGDNRVTHNEIADLFYSGVSVGWRWGYGESLAKRNLVTHNHIHHIGYGVLSDMGAVYTLGPSEGTKVNNNVIHDIYSYNYGGWGLYTDEGSSNIEMASNLVYHCKSGGFHQHYGRDNTIRNNIIAFNELYQLRVSRVEEHRSIFFRNNIVIYDSGTLCHGKMDQARISVDKNIYWDASGRPVTFHGRSLAEWQDLGHDRNSLIADPIFVNAKELDFRLKPGSPALQVGFKEFDYSQAGVYGDNAWKQMARSVPVKRLRIAPQPPKRDGK